MSFSLRLIENTENYPIYQENEHKLLSKKHNIFIFIKAPIIIFLNNLWIILDNFFSLNKSRFRNSMLISLKNRIKNNKVIPLTISLNLTKNANRSMKQNIDINIRVTIKIPPVIFLNEIKQFQS